MSSRRTPRVEKVLNQVISSLIIRGDIKDHRVSSLLSITSVSVSKDLSYADIQVSGYMDDQSLAKGVEGLNSAAGYIQSQLARELKTRNTPKLRFRIDLGVREGFAMTKRIEELLENESPSTGNSTPE